MKTLLLKFQRKKFITYYNLSQTIALHKLFFIVTYSETIRRFLIV
jgi:hypothetical protein